MGRTRPVAGWGCVLTARIAPLTDTDLADARALAVLAEVPVGSADTWRADLATPRKVLLGAWLGERLVGVATALVAADAADVLLVVVDPPVRRQGVGRALTRALCHTLAAHGADRALLEVRAANTAATALYASVGFTEVARRRSYYRDGEDAVVLALALDAA